MKICKKGEYLAPEAEVVNLMFKGNVLLNTSGDITDSTENPTVGW